jgi:hypothetical protein
MGYTSQPQDASGPAVSTRFSGIEQPLEGRPEDPPHYLGVIILPLAFDASLDAHLPPKTKQVDVSTARCHLAAFFFASPCPNLLLWAKKKKKKKGKVFVFFGGLVK